MDIIATFRKKIDCRGAEKIPDIIGALWGKSTFWGEGGGEGWSCASVAPFGIKITFGYRPKKVEKLCL